MQLKYIIWRLAFVSVGAATTFVATSFFASAADIATPKWTEWEQANSVAREGQWLVIRQPDEGFCYIKQGYDGYSDKMDISMKRDGIPYLTTPFFRGIQGDVSYRVDQGATRIVPENEASPLGIKLSPEIVPELKRGSMVIVRVKPVGRPTLQQSFDLRGFTAASRFLGSSICQKKVPDQYQY